MERNERPFRWYVPTRLDEADGGNHDINELDADERGDDAAEPVDQQVAAQDRSRGTGTVAHALERQRDEQDENRPVAPLRKAEDAALLDTTNLDLKGSLEALLTLVRERLSL